MFGAVTEGGEHPRETVSGVLSTVRIDAVRRVGDVVEYLGVVRDSSTSRPLRIKFEPTDGSIRMDVLVPAVDALAIHLDWRPATTGIAPALPERTLRERAYWVDPTVIAQPAFTWVLGTDVTIGPVQVPRAVDLRQDGRIAVHVWAPRAVVTVTDTPRMP